jgi:hypothetical protein
MLETGKEDEHIHLINIQMEFGSTIGMMPSLIPYTKWTWLPIPWLQSLQAGRERLKEVSALGVCWRVRIADKTSSLQNLVSSEDRRKSATGKIFWGDSSRPRTLSQVRCWILLI